MERANNTLEKFKGRIFKKKTEKVVTVVDRLNGIMKCINTFAYFTGLEFTADWKRNGRYGFAVVMNFILSYLGLSTSYIIFPSTDNIVMVGGMAFNAAVWTKLIFIFCNHKKYVVVVQFIFKVLRSNSCGPRERILVEMTKKVIYHLKVNISIILVTVSLYAAYPTYDLIFNGNLTLVSPVILPFVDPRQLRGYWINTGFNTFLISYCITVCIAISSLFFVFVDAYDGLVSLIEYDFRTFDAMCENKKNDRTYEAPFRNLMMGLTDLARFSINTNDLFGVISTVQVAASYLVVVCCLGPFLAFDYGSGLGGALGYFIEMLLFCYLGQLLYNTNERVVNMIYNSKWYTYDVKYQKNIITALYIAQNLQPIYLANVYPLNFDTGLRMTNQIYSFIMFLLNMFD